MSKPRESRPEFAMASSSDKAARRLGNYLTASTEAVFDDPSAARNSLIDVSDESELAVAVASSRAAHGEDAPDRVLRAAAMLLASGFYESVKLDTETQRVADAIAVQMSHSEVSPLSPGEVDIISLQAFATEAVRFAAFEAEQRGAVLADH